MDELIALRELLATRRPVDWAQLPDIPLYMDQVLAYMERQTIRVDEADGLTSAMVNNYTKSGLVPRAEGKKYGREHIAYLTAICALKQVMSAKDMAVVLAAFREEGEEIEALYTRFAAGLDDALTRTATEVDSYQSQESVAEAAVHFALLSYAAGLASRRYVSLLEPLPEGKRKKKKTEEIEK
ncbi:MAG: DUF1836 domain-containing protein [Oscillospiraceae bacterium]